MIHTLDIHYSEDNNTYMVPDIWGQASNNRQKKCEKWVITAMWKVKSHTLLLWWHRGEEGWQHGGTKATVTVGTNTLFVNCGPCRHFSTLGTSRWLHLCTSLVTCLWKYSHWNGHARHSQTRCVCSGCWMSAAWEFHPLRRFVCLFSFFWGLTAFINKGRELG